MHYLNSTLIEGIVKTEVKEDFESSFFVLDCGNDVSTFTLKVVVVNPSLGKGCKAYLRTGTKVRLIGSLSDQEGHIVLVPEHVECISHSSQEGNR
jgi:hypothetical protein